MKKCILRSFTKLTRKHLCQSLFLIRLQAWGLQLYLKGNCCTVFFLWILRNFEEHLFYRTPLENCFCALWSATTGNSYHRTSKTVAARKPTAVSMILYQNILSNFQEPWVEQPKQLLNLKKLLTVKLLMLSV